MRIIWLLHTGVVWHTSHSPHTIIAPWRVRIGIGCAMAFLQWVFASEITRLFYDIEISALPKYGNWGVVQTHNFHFRIIKKLCLHVAMCGWNKYTKCEERDALSPLLGNEIALPKSRFDPGTSDWESRVLSSELWQLLFIIIIIIIIIIV